MFSPCSYWELTLTVSKRDWRTGRLKPTKNRCAHFKMPFGFPNLSQVCLKWIYLTLIKGPQSVHNRSCHLCQRCSGQSHLWTDLHLAGQQDQRVHGEQGEEKSVWQMTNPRHWGWDLLTRYFHLFLFLSGPFKKDCDRSFGHIWIWGFLCEQVGRNLPYIVALLWFSLIEICFWKTANLWVILLWWLLFVMTHFPQFWAVLYKLLQREAAAAFHPVDAQGWAGGIWSRGYWGKPENKMCVTMTTLTGVFYS